MKTCLVVIGLLVLSPFLTLAGDGAAELKETLKLMSAMTEIFKSVKDKASADAALPNLKPIDKKLVVLVKNQSEHKPSAEELKQMKGTFKAFNSELERVKKIPEVKALFAKELTFFKDLDDAKLAAAKAQIKGIDSVILAYHRQTKKFPTNLAALTEGKNPFISGAGALVDPWKTPYRYDASGPKNNGEKPDVWTVTPDMKVIGNWDKEVK